MLLTIDLFVGHVRCLLDFPDRYFYCKKPLVYVVIESPLPNRLKQEYKLTRWLFFSNAAYSRQPEGVKLLFWTRSGIPSRHSPTVQHYMPATVRTFH